jgi:hypothetical protein
VWVTIAITIVRGSVFHQQYSMAATGDAKQMQSGTFTWFWFYMEFSVAFLIACIVSFRSLFVQRAKKESAPRQEQAWREAAFRSALRRGWRARLQNLHDSVLDKCKTLEGWSDADTLHNDNGLPTVPSGLMTVDFHDDANWKKNAGPTATMTTVTSVRGDAEYQQYQQYQQAQYQHQQYLQAQYQQPPQYQQDQQNRYPQHAPTGSLHSEETLLQDPEVVYLRPDVVGVAR